MGIFQIYHDENSLYSMKWWWWCPICSRQSRLLGFS